MDKMLEDKIDDLMDALQEVQEHHRTQSALLDEALLKLLPNASPNELYLYKTGARSINGL